MLPTILLTTLFAIIVVGYVWLRMGPKRCPNCRRRVWDNLDRWKYAVHIPFLNNTCISSATVAHY